MALRRESGARQPPLQRGSERGSDFRIGERNAEAERAWRKLEVETTKWPGFATIVFIGRRGGGHVVLRPNLGLVPSDGKSTERDDL